MKELLSNFLTVSIFLILATLIVLPESILLGAEIFVLLFSILIFFLANEKNICVFRKLCTYFGLLSVGLMVALLRSELILIGKNMYGITSIIGTTLCEGNYIVGYTIICLFLISLLYISHAEFVAIGKINCQSEVRKEYENEIKILLESSKPLCRTAKFTGFIHICFFMVGLLVALCIANNSFSGAFHEIAKKLESFSVMVIVPQLIVWGAFKKLCNSIEL